MARNTGRGSRAASRSGGQFERAKKRGGSFKPLPEARFWLIFWLKVALWAPLTIRGRGFRRWYRDLAMTRRLNRSPAYREAVRTAEIESALIAARIRSGETIESVDLDILVARLRERRAGQLRHG